MTDIGNGEDITALLRAIACGSSTPKTITALVEAGEDVNAKDSDGKTMRLTIEHEYTSEVINLLTQAGTDSSARYGITQHNESQE